MPSASGYTENALPNDQGIWQTFDAYLTSNEDEAPLVDSERFVSFRIQDLYPEWQKDGRCYGVGTEYFFGNEDEQPTMSIKQVRQASKLCDVCPVFVDCLTWALSTKEEYGVWAGTSGRVRRKIQRVIEAGEVTVEQVVEDFTHGRGSIYSALPSTKRSGGERDHGSVSELPSRASVRAEARRDATA